MTNDQKVIRNKVGLLELAKQARQCQPSAQDHRGTAVTAPIASRSCTTKVASWPSRRSVARSRARDFERYAHSTVAFVRLAMIRIMLQCLTRIGPCP